MLVKNSAKVTSAASNLLENILEKMEEKKVQMHASTLEQIAVLTQRIAHDLGGDFTEDKRMIIAEQLTNQVLRNKSIGSSMLTKIGLGKIKVQAKRLEGLVDGLIAKNKKDSRIYSYEKNILAKIKSNKITKRHFINGISSFVKLYPEKLSKNYQKSLLALNEKTVGKLTKSELAELRNIDPAKFDELVLTAESKGEKKPIQGVHVPLKVRRRQQAAS